MNQKTQASAAAPCDETRPSTGWNPGDTMPPAPGIYQRDYQKILHPGIFDNPAPFFCRWDGRRWFAGFSQMCAAERTERTMHPAFSKMPWREIPEDEVSA